MRAAYGPYEMQLAELVGHLSETGGTGPYFDIKDPVQDLIADAAEVWVAWHGRLLNC